MHIRTFFENGRRVLGTSVTSKGGLGLALRQTQMAPIGNYSAPPQNLKSDMMRKGRE